MIQATLKVKVIWRNLQNGASIARTGPSAPTKSNLTFLSKQTLQQHTLGTQLSTTYVYF